MIITLSILIAALALLIVVAACVGYWLHKKVGIYKDQQKKWAKEPCIEGVQFALRTLRKYSAKYHPEGEPQLNLATYKITQYLKQYRFNLDNGINIQGK